VRAGLVVADWERPGVCDLAGVCERPGVWAGVCVSGERDESRNAGDGAAMLKCSSPGGGNVGNASPGFRRRNAGDAENCQW
jgi:hypothetical protein